MTKGPPVIRLNHGILYQDVPCICRGYSIKYDKAAGMDMETLLNRRIHFSMDLDEFRAGDFGEYKLNEVVKKDNVTGWESIIKNSTTDPGRGLL